MRRSIWLTAAILAFVLVVPAGRAVAKKGGDKPGGGGGDGGTSSPLDILVTVAEGNGYGSLYGLQEDGSGQTYLAPDRGGHTWAPDGTRIAFYSEGFSEGYGVYLMDMETGAVEMLIPMSSYTRGSLDWCPVPEADGTQKLAFTMRDATTDRGCDVFVARLDDTGLLDYENITQTPGDDGSPSWSPSGEQVAIGYFDQIRVLDLRDRDATTGLPAVHVVYESTQVSPYDCAWAKTRNQLAFTAYDTADAHPLLDVYLLTVAQDPTTGAWKGSLPQNLTGTPNDEETGALTWSPDDSHILCHNVYWRQLGKGTGKGSLQLIDVESGAREEFGGTGSSPDWKRVTD